MDIYSIDQFQCGLGASDATNNEGQQTAFRAGQIRVRERCRALVPEQPGQAGRATTRAGESVSGRSAINDDTGRSAIDDNTGSTFRLTCDHRAPHSVGPGRPGEASTTAQTHHRGHQGGDSGSDDTNACLGRRTGGAELPGGAARRRPAAVVADQYAPERQRRDAAGDPGAK